MLPESEERPHIARDMYRELRAAVRPDSFDDAVRAFAAATEALAEGDTGRAVELLEWIKTVGGRSAAVREALGIALYHAGRFEDAHRELVAYRRISNRADQNHLLADCARAVGRHDRVAEYVGQMRDDPEVPRDRFVEGLIVLAGDRADRGDLRGALLTLEEAELEPAQVEAWHQRVWYAAGDIAERMGDRALAREYFGAILAVDEDYLDVGERLAALA